MHRILIFVVAGMLGAPIVHADEGASLLSDEGAKRLSLQVSLGIRPDMAGLGATITKDGTVATSDTTMASLVYSTSNALMSDRDNLVLFHGSDNSMSEFSLLGEEPEQGGSMLGLEFGAGVQYELDDVIGLPFYVRAGFHYSSKISGGNQIRVLGDAAQASPLINGLLRANGEDPADYINGRMVSNYSASWTEIPVSIGLKVALNKPNSFVYGGFGFSGFRGGFSVELQADENYTNVLATHIDADAGTINNLSPGAIDEKVEFIAGNLGLNWHLGAQVGLGKSDAVLYFELNTSGTARTVFSNEMSPELRQVLTATSSETLAEADPQWFKRLAFPVLTAGAQARVGLRYYLF